MDDIFFSCAFQSNRIEWQTKTKIEVQTQRRCSNPWWDGKSKWEMVAAQWSSASTPKGEIMRVTSTWWIFFQHFFLSHHPLSTRMHHHPPISIRRKPIKHSIGCSDDYGLASNWSNKKKVHTSIVCGCLSLFSVNEMQWLEARESKGRRTVEKLCYSASAAAATTAGNKKKNVL